MAQPTDSRFAKERRQRCAGGCEYRTSRSHRQRLAKLAARTRALGAPDETAKRRYQWRPAIRALRTLDARRNRPRQRTRTGLSTCLASAQPAPPLGIQPARKAQTYAY